MGGAGGDGPALPGWGQGGGAEACSFLSGPHRGSGLEGKKDRKGSPLGNIRISGQGLGSTPSLTAMAASHLVLKSAELVFKHMPALVRTQDPFPAGAPVGKGENKSEKGVLLQVHIKGWTRTVLLPTFKNVLPLSLMGPVPELWPRSPWTLYSQETLRWGPLL